MNISKGLKRVLGRAGGLAVCMAVLACAYALPANALTFYEDTETGQLFTKPGPGRVQIEGEVIIVKPDASDASARPESHDGEQWYDNFDFWADLRLRYEFRLHEHEDARSTRHRGRYRFRLGTEAKVNSQVRLGAELRSGGSARSDNQTFSDNFDKFEIYIAKAYATWTPVEWLSVTGGQFGNPLYKPKDLVWDSDINPQGAALTLAPEFGGFSPFFTAGFWIIDQVSNDDPLLIPVQVGAEVKAGPAKIKGAVTYYAYTNMKNQGYMPESARTNTLDPMNGTLMYDYDAIGASGEVAFKLPPIGEVKVFGDYVNNFDPSAGNVGWMAGAKIASGKIKEFGDWEMFYNYRRLGVDAIPDFLPDSDAYGGETGITAHEAGAKLGLGKHVEFGLDFYHARQIMSNDDEYLLQADLIFKAK